ncbi:galectin-3 isoform X1 [Danio aesculapii]|uniref:galectin-3 isoform X1 n=1 Tax=Danio aesculapii TaxID=1142201 RepID=UPI0024BF68FB|nr:galectin-3 isoform X1 [Danio aesculapii]XP_056326949.1 galectin-3 isoform X1 [Danio aesculapii]
MADFSLADAIPDDVPSEASKNKHTNPSAPGNGAPPPTNPGWPGAAPGGPHFPPSGGPVQPAGFPQTWPSAPGSFPPGPGAPGQFPGAPAAPGQFPGAPAAPGGYPPGPGVPGQFPPNPGAPGQFPSMPGQFPPGGAPMPYPVPGQFPSPPGAPQGPNPNVPYPPGPSGPGMYGPGGPGAFPPDGGPGYGGGMFPPVPAGSWGQPGGGFPAHPGPPGGYGPGPMGPYGGPAAPGGMPLPYDLPLRAGIMPHLLITIVGEPIIGGDRFQVDFMRGHEVVFHFNPRFHENTVVRNSQLGGLWGPEEREGGFPFVQGRQFELKILVETDGFKVAVDSVHLLEFEHRTGGMEDVTRLRITGDVTLFSAAPSMI